MSAVLCREELDGLVEVQAVRLRVDAILRSRGAKALPNWADDLGPNFVAEVVMRGIELRGVNVDLLAKAVLREALAEKERDISIYVNEFGVVTTFIAKLLSFRAWLAFKEFKRIVEAL